MATLDPTVSASLQLSDMFNFEIIDYIPYIAVTVILLILIILETILEILRPLYVIWISRITYSIYIALIIFLLFILPSIFFYVTKGVSTVTITLISADSVAIIILSFSLSLLRYPCFDRNAYYRMFLIISAFVIIIDFICLFIITPGFDVKIHVPFIVILLLVIFLLLFCCCCSLDNEYWITMLMGEMILVEILHYLLYYGILKEVNKISLLLFWANLWLILISISRIFIPKFQLVFVSNYPRDYPRMNVETP